MAVTGPVPDIVSNMVVVVEMQHSELLPIKYNNSTCYLFYITDVSSSYIYGIAPQ